MITTEKQFESDIAAALLSPAGGYTRNGDCYDPKLGLFVDTLIRFVQKTQPNEWAFFEKQNPVNPVRKFCTAFNNACDADGLLSVLRYGFKHRGRRFRVCYFQPESALNQKDAQRYAQNEITCNRQWFYSDTTHNSVDMVLAVNGIPVFTFELKNQFTGQTVENAKQQWMHDRDPREVCFQFNKRILGYFCVDLTEVWMATRLAGKDTRFLPFNQGSNGAGRDGGAGNPPNPNGYLTAYLWEEVFQKDSMMDILQKRIQAEKQKTHSEKQYNPLAESTLEYLEQHFRENPSLNRIAADLNYSVPHICRVFKQNYNESIVNYLTKLKIDEALKLIELNNHSFREISDSLGFDNVAYFTRIFKQQTGMTPSAYRKFAVWAHLLNSQYLPKNLKL